MHGSRGVGPKKSDAAAPEGAKSEPAHLLPERNPFWFGVATRTPGPVTVAPPDDPSETAAARAPAGHPLPSAEQAFFGPRFAVDFRQVRLHTDARADAAAKALHARAFTLGPDISFRSGQYAPGTHEGRRLLGHELTHVVQQAGAGPAAGAVVHRAPADPGAIHFLAEDTDAAPGPGQMRRTEFMDELRRAVCESVEPALASQGRTATGCPYLDAVFTHAAGRDSRYLEQAVRRFVPEVPHTATARELIAPIAARARENAELWATTGEIRGVPDDISPLSLMRDSVLGAVGRVLFKPASGGARADMAPAAIQGELGAGAPVESGVRSRMESAFGTSFAHVRAHADSSAAGLADRFNARAFTVGEHVAFGAGEYRPETLAGEALIAHELAHVVQQRRGASAGQAAREGRGSGTTELEEDADSAAIGAVTGLPGVDGLGPATPRLSSALRLQRCDPEEEAEPHITEIDDREALRRRGFELVIPPGEPVVGRSYTIGITTPDVVSARHSVDSYAFSRWYQWRPNGAERVRSTGVGRSQTFTLDAEGQWNFMVEIPLGVDTIGIFRHQVTVRPAAAVADERIAGAQQTGLTGFLVRLELQNLQNVRMGMAEQRFGSTYISLQGENPSRAYTNFPDNPINRYTVHPPEGATPARYQWLAVPEDLSGYPTQGYHGHTRRVIGGREGFEMGTAATASWVLSMETGLIDIYCTMFDAAGTQIAEARYRQVILTSAEQAHATAFRAYRDEARVELRRLRENSAVHLPAVHVANETGGVNEITLFVGTAATGSGLKLIDVTPGVPVREYSGTDFNALLADFTGSNAYPPGVIRLRIPANTFGMAAQTLPIVTTGASVATRLSTGWGWASLGFAGLGVLALVVPGAQPLAPAFFLASAALGAASAGASLYQRSREAHPNGLSVAIDIAALAGSLIGMAGAVNVLRHGPRIAALTRTGQFVLYGGFAGDAVGGVFMTIQGAGQIADILEGPGTADDKVAMVVRILGGLLVNGALLAWGSRDLAATRTDVTNRLGRTMAGQLTTPELHALSVLDGPSLAQLAGGSIDDVKRIASLVHQDPAQAARLIERYGSSQFVQGGRGQAMTLEELSTSLNLQRRAALVGYAAANLGTVVDAAAATGLSRQLGVEVRIDTTLTGGQIQVEYRAGSLLTETRMGIRVSPGSTVGDILLHAVALDTIREYRVLSTNFSGLYQRARAWLTARRMPRATELAVEIEKHALMVEARLVASRGQGMTEATHGLLQRDIDELTAWMALFRRELNDLGAPAGVIGAQWSESFSQRQLEAILDAAGSGFERYRHPGSGRPISEPGFRQGAPIDMGRGQAYYARRLSGSTFPDVYGRQIGTGQMVSMELKTPYAGDTVASFFQRAEVRDNILREMGGRIEHLPPGTVSHLVVDLRGTGQAIPAALTDLSTVLRSYGGGDARGLWHGVRFITGSVDAPVLSGVQTIP